ncbi:Hypothetical protein, putative [Bodo saltans]|uniref:Membrane-associated protein n=1 Tax=Bodo saltans TaxID=75058 RepID=A0A0S4JQW0_BODSA|nr:Hypothetical protein, putative [Bodo saltans]|eukprot:CUG91754.1 Hypothetical protein, putative [Bodo saltans]
MMRRFIATLALFVISVSCSNTYVVGPAGDFISSSPVPGYILATLADIQSEGFLSLYNAIGLSVADNTPNPLPSSECPFIAVQGGYLATGSPLSVSPTVVAPFSSSEVLEVGSLSGPVWFGVAYATAYSTNNEYIGAFNTSFVESLFVLGAAAINQLGLSCNPAYASAAIYRKAQFMIAPYGSNYPTPPTSEALFATIADISSDTFLESYNINGLVASSSAASHVCCAIRVQGGYVTLSSSTLAPYTAQGDLQCPSKTLQSPVWFGTADNGAYPDNYIGPLNHTVLSSLTTSSSQPSVCGTDDVNVWALYKVHTIPSAPTPAPATGDCYNMEVQVSYYLSDGTICIAERWSYYMKLGTVYQYVGMTSINECGGSIGAVNAYNLELQAYNESYMVGRTTGASSCDCTGVTNWGFVPLNESGHGYKSTICYLPIEVYYFCEVLMWLNNGPVQCPPSP